VTYGTVSFTSGPKDADRAEDITVKLDGLLDVRVGNRVRVDVLGATPEPRTDDGTGIEGFAILELMGHRKLAGRLAEQEIAGQAFVRIDIPGPPGEADTATQFYSAAAIYAITPTTEEIARAVAAGHQPQPVTRWEIQAIEAQPRSTHSLDEFDQDTLDPDDVEPF
jgi:hypothetical protein